MERPEVDLERVLIVMTTSARQIRAYQGPAILSFGFRPLFFVGAVWAALAMSLWIAVLIGTLTLPSALSPTDWHAHELLFGYLPAVAAGFLLTAIPNWTGRLPITGVKLLILVSIWVIGRLAVLTSGWIGLLPAAFGDLSFLAIFGSVVAREIFAGRSWRNLKVLLLLAGLFCGNALFHLEAFCTGQAANGYGARIGIGAAVLLVMIIGGRIIPSFTRNWLARQPQVPLPAPFGKFDVVSIAVAGISLGTWVAWPARTETAILCLLAAILQFIRLGRWGVIRTGREPLIWILHMGYFFVPLGFLAVFGTSLEPDFLSAKAALHAWTAGAIGVMTLAVMTRASLGHTGRPLKATPGTTFIYFCVVTSAVLRVASGVGNTSAHLLLVAAGLWVLAFGAFSVLYGRMLIKPKPPR